MWGKKNGDHILIKKKVIYYKANLCEHIFILHHQRVGVYMPGKEVLSVALCASLGSALHVLGAWRETKGNQSEVNYNHLPSNSTLYALELLYSMHLLNIQ